MNEEFINTNGVLEFNLCKAQGTLLGDDNDKAGLLSWILANPGLTYRDLFLQGLQKFLQHAPHG